MTGLLKSGEIAQSMKSRYSNYSKMSNAVKSMNSYAALSSSTYLGARRDRNWDLPKADDFANPSKLLFQRRLCNKKSLNVLPPTKLKLQINHINNNIPSYFRESNNDDYGEKNVLLKMKSP